MNKQELPIFPKFVWDEYFWITSVYFSKWAGFQNQNGPYGSISDNRTSDGNIKIVFAPEGRSEGPLLDNEKELVKWVIDNQDSLYDCLINTLFESYPKIRKEFLDYVDQNETNDLLPRIFTPEEIKKITGIVSINVHPIKKDGKPYVGIELGCTWDDEHGLGVLFCGTELIEIGGADTAILLWIAEKHAKKS